MYRHFQWLQPIEKEGIEKSHFFDSVGKKVQEGLFYHSVNSYGRKKRKGIESTSKISSIRRYCPSDKNNRKSASTHEPYGDKRPGKP